MYHPTGRPLQLFLQTLRPLWWSVICEGGVIPRCQPCQVIFPSIGFLLFSRRGWDSSPALALLDCGELPAISSGWSLTIKDGGWGSLALLPKGKQQVAFYKWALHRQPIPLSQTHHSGLECERKRIEKLV